MMPLRSQKPGRLPIGRHVSDAGHRARVVAIALLAVPLLSPGLGAEPVNVPGLVLQDTAPPPPRPQQPPAAVQPAPDPGKAKAAAPDPKKSKAPKKAVTAPDAPKAAAKPEKTAKADDGAAAKGGGRSHQISILVNDDPITEHQIQRRAAFLSVSSGGGGANADFKAKAEARWQQIVKDPRTNERFKALLAEKQVSTKEEAQKLQGQFVRQLQQNMLDQLRSEMRKVSVSGNRGKAVDELVDERLKLQEAKRLSALAEDADVEKILASMAERNKMTVDQFDKHLQGFGADVDTLRTRFRAELSWREVVRRRFGHQVSIADKDVDRLVASTPSGGDDEVELQVQRITLAMPAKVDNQSLARRIADADAIAGRFSGCTNTASLAAATPDARFEDLGMRKPSSIPEPTRSYLLLATDNSMLPPSVASGGVELWALCGRKHLVGDDQKREQAQGQLRQTEFEILARKAIKDLRQESAICAPRASTPVAGIPPCGDSRS